MVQDVDLFNALRTQFDEAQAKTIVEIMSSKIANHYEDKKDILATKKDVSESKSEIIKWIFIFIMGQTALLIAVMKLI